MTPLLSCAHLEEMLHLAEAAGCRVREVSDGWSKVSKVISMEPELPDSIRAAGFPDQPNVRYYATTGSPHNQPDEGFVCGVCEVALSFPRPDISFRRPAFGVR
jgi:hypothetical protein